MLNVLFLYYGFFALLAQLVIFRELSVLFYGNELFLGVFLSSWLFWVGLGSLWARLLSKKKLDLEDYFSYGFLILSLLLPLVVLSIRLSRGLFSFGEFIGPVGTVLFTFLVMSFLCLLVGGQFSLACAVAGDKWSPTGSRPSHLFFRSSARGAEPRPSAYGGLGAGSNPESALGRVYLCEALGSVIAGVLFTYFLIGSVPTFIIVCLLSLGCILASWGLFNKGMDLRKAGLALTALALLPVYLKMEPGINKFQWKKYQLIEQKEGRHATLTLVKTGSIKNVFVDGMISASFPNPENYEPVAHWPLLATAEARRVLVLGDFSLGVLKEVLKHSPQSVDYAVLDDSFLDLVKPYLGPEDLSSLKDPRVHVHYGDPRVFVKKKEGPYDAVIIDISEVPNLKLNRFYTREFYAQLKAMLEPHGVLVLNASSSENYLSKQTRMFDASVYRTLKSVFETVEMIPGDNITFLASPSALDMRKETILERFKTRGIKTRNFVPSYIQYRLNPGRRLELKRLLEETPGIETNKDFRPTSYYYFTNFWLNKLGSPIGFLMGGVLLAMFSYIVFQKRRSWMFLIHKKESLLIFFIGFMMIVLELMFLLAFQIISGYVYWQMGMLFASFMLGLFLGSAGAARLKYNSKKTNSVFLALSSLVMSGFSFGSGYLLPRFINLTPFENIAIFLMLLIFAGGVGGAAFVIAGFVMKTDEVMEKAGNLYAADLWGSALGAMLLTNLIIPLFGFLGALNFSGTAGLAGLAAYLILSSKPGRS